jgi:hypothetical protein
MSRSRLRILQTRWSRNLAAVIVDVFVSVVVLNLFVEYLPR